MQGICIYIYIYVGRKLIKENQRAKVPKQVVRISWLNGEAAGCQDQVALDMVSFLANQTSGKLAHEPSPWIGSHQRPNHQLAGQLASWFAGAWPNQFWDHRAFDEG